MIGFNRPGAFGRQRKEVMGERPAVNEEPAAGGATGRSSDARDVQAIDVGSIPGEEVGLFLGRAAAEDVLVGVPRRDEPTGPAIWREIAFHHAAVDTKGI